jgi:hypothetical protein
MGKKRDLTAPNTEALTRATVEGKVRNRRHADPDELTGPFRRGTGDFPLTDGFSRPRRSGQSPVLATNDVACAATDLYRAKPNRAA